MYLTQPSHDPDGPRVPSHNPRATSNRTSEEFVDLGDRSLVFHLPPIANSKRRTEDELWEASNDAASPRWPKSPQWLNIELRHIAPQRRILYRDKLARGARPRVSHLSVDHTKPRSVQLKPDPHSSFDGDIRFQL